MENNKKSSGVDKVLAFLLTPLVVALVLLNLTYPAYLTWNMFVPNMFGLPHLTLAQTLLTIVTFALFCGSRTHRTDDTRSKEQKAEDLIMYLIAPWVGYIIAFVTYRFFVL